MTHNHQANKTGGSVKLHEEQPTFSQFAMTACCKNQTKGIVDIPPITVFLKTAVSMANIQTWLSTITLFYRFSCRYTFHGKVHVFPFPLPNPASSSVWSESHRSFKGQWEPICFLLRRMNVVQVMQRTRLYGSNQDKKAACDFLWLQESCSWYFVFLHFALRRHLWVNFTFLLLYTEFLFAFFSSEAPALQLVACR